MSETLIRENFLGLRERIAAAARRAGRGAAEITLIGVSKTKPVEAIREAFAAGVRHFGENRVQEWEGKRAALGHFDATWHLVGHLQSNKAGRAARIFHSVDSVDDLALAERLNRTRVELQTPGKLRVLIEVHVGGEQSKSGAAVDGVFELAEKMATFERLELGGLMCIPPFFEDAERARPYFAQVRELRDELAKKLKVELPALSMGMSHDFEAAIAEGATEVRVGTALFGAR
jgi:pyridoxal phosphate enzyme (YggS family)